MSLNFVDIYWSVSAMMIKASKIPRLGYGSKTCLWNTWTYIGLDMVTIMKASKTAGVEDFKGKDETSAETFYILHPSTKISLNISSWEKMNRNSTQRRESNKESGFATKYWIKLTLYHTTLHWNAVITFNMAALFLHWLSW